MYALPVARPAINTASTVAIAKREWPKIKPQGLDPRDLIDQSRHAGEKETGKKGDGVLIQRFFVVSIDDLPLILSREAIDVRDSSKESSLDHFVSKRTDALNYAGDASEGESVLNATVAFSCSVCRGVQLAFTN